MKLAHDRLASQATLLVALASLWPHAATAVTTTWVGATGGAWSAAANWSAGVPGAADTAFIAPATPLAGSVQVAAPTSVGGLVLSNAALALQAGLSVGGSFEWRQDQLSSSTVLALLNLSTMRVAGAALLTGDGAKGVNNTGVLDLAGTANWRGNTQATGNTITVGISPGTSPTLRNSGVYIDGNAYDSGITGRGTFDNQGNYVKNGASVTTVDIASFRNAGSVNVQAGTLRLVTMTGTQSGSWNTGAGGVIEITGGTPTLTGALGGDGTLLLRGGTVSIEGSGRTLAVVLDGAALAGSQVVYDGGFTWRSGTMAGAGNTTWTGNVVIEGTARKVIESGRNITSYGQTAWTGSALVIGSGSSQATTFVNLGEFRDVEPTRFRNITSDIGDPTLASFRNLGTYVKDGANGTAVSLVKFDNQGTLDVRRGYVRFDLAPSNTGRIDVAANAAVYISNDLAAFENRGTVSGAGQIFSSAAGQFINHGVVSPGAGLAELQISWLTLAADGSLAIDLGAGGASDRLVVQQTVTLGGILDLWNRGTSMQVGDTFTVLSYAARAGTSTFDDIRLNGFAPGASFRIVYGANDVQVVVTSVPEPGATLLWLAGLGMVAVCCRRTRVPAAKDA